MVDELIEMYRDGAITGYQVMIDCLHMLDPDHPDLVLSHLPEEILEEMFEYTHRFDPSCMLAIGGAPPTVDQVKAAQQWILEKTRKEVAERGGGQKTGHR